MVDRFGDRNEALNSPASHGFVIVPHDGNDLVEVTRGLYVAGAGALVLTMASGADVSLANVAAGSVLPLRVRRVKATGTTATGLVGLV